MMNFLKNTIKKILLGLYIKKNSKKNELFYESSDHFTSLSLLQFKYEFSHLMETLDF